MSVELQLYKRLKIESFPIDLVTIEMRKHPQPLPRLSDWPVTLSDFHSVGVCGM